MSLSRFFGAFSALGEFGVIRPWDVFAAFRWAAGAVGLVISAVSSAAPPLPALAVARDQSSISGISSGAAMAVQFGVVHSSIIVGVGVIAGPPYGCAANDLSTATNVCMAGTTPIDVARLVDKTRRRADDGSIDPLTSLSRQRVWLFGGGDDNVVRPAVHTALRAYYLSLLPAAQLKDVSIAQAAHTMPTRDFGNPCGVSTEPFISQCGVESSSDADAAGELLAWIYPGLVAPPVASPTATSSASSVATSPATTGRLIEFDQTEFIGAPFDHSMDGSGWAYVPQICETTGGCRVHVALHGCKQYQRHEYYADGDFRKIGKTFVEHAGYNRWADANRIIVLYPQANARPLSVWEMFLPARYYRANPYGCWDWWGYDGSDYDTRNGWQIQAIRKMIDRLAQSRNS